MNQTPDLTMAMVKMVLSLAVILALLWAAHRWMRRVLPAGRMSGRDRLIKVLSSHSLGMKKSVALVQVPGKVLVIGIGADQVNLLAHIDDPQVLAELMAQEEQKGTIRFSEHLQRMTRHFKHPSDKRAVTLDQGGMA
jgi:flagellar biosynthetic protein FliO